MNSEYNLPPKYLTVTQRNYVLYKSAENQGICYLRHPSGVFVITLGNNHEAKNKVIKSFCWEAQKKNHHGVDRNKLSICGKNKKGGLETFPETRLCTIIFCDGTECVIRAGIRATLIEVNSERLSEEPNLARTFSDSHGFLAILIPARGEAQNLLYIPKNLTKTENNVN